MAAIERDIVIVGAGPAGVTMANLLAGYGLSVLIIDRESDIVEEPRAVGIDDEALRTLQSFGMAEAVLENAVRNAPIRYFDSHGKMLAHVAPSGRPYGWPRRNLFFQPNLEQVLRRSLERFPNVELWTSCEAYELHQDVAGVTLSARRNEAAVPIRAKYLVGADGGRSFVRKATKIEMEGDTAPMKWLVVDVAKDIWDAPYSAVYTSPHRPAMTIPLPFAHRRFEFKILDGEDPEVLVQPDKVAELMRRFYPDGQVPPAVRRHIYWHHSRTAATFQNGRVFLVGDAAHLQPPFFGQGMNSGIRDVTNLAWKLGMVLTGKASSSLLSTYDEERRENARIMVEFATGIGQLYHPRNRLTEAIRNWLFRAAQRIPGARDYVLQMKYKPTPRYDRGFVLHPVASDKSSPVGRAFPQPLVELSGGKRVRLDDVFGDRIAILGLAPGIVQALGTDTLAKLNTHNVVVVQSNVTPAYRREGQPGPSSRATTPGATTIDVFDIEGGLRDILLNRPSEEVIVIRPDRYVAAACALDDADRTICKLLKLLEGAGSFTTTVQANGLLRSSP